MPSTGELARLPEAGADVEWRRCQCPQAPPYFLNLGQPTKNQRRTAGEQVGWKATRQIRNRRTTSEAMPSNYRPYFRGWERMTDLEHLYDAAGIFLPE